MIPCLQMIRSKTIVSGIFYKHTAASGHSDAHVRGTSAVHDSPVDTSVVIGHRLHQRRVEEVRASIPAAVVVVAVPSSIVPAVS